MERIWDGVKYVCRFLNRLFEIYFVFCLVVGAGLWVVGSIHTGRALSLDELIALDFNWLIRGW